MKARESKPTPTDLLFPRHSGIRIQTIPEKRRTKRCTECRSAALVT